uniref:Uncharacterized protein n=1 Tax=Rhipicephalus zambeziensis TaxID=60191 RepID=A0A224Y5E5_9ACAR
MFVITKFDGILSLYRSSYCYESLRLHVHMNDDKMKVANVSIGVVALGNPALPTHITWCVCNNYHVSMLCNTVVIVTTKPCCQDCQQALCTTDQPKRVL